jgi:hypothetical protein
LRRDVPVNRHARRARFLAGEREKFGKVVRELGITMD